MDELVLGYTHPAIFHSDRFSVYYLEIEYQLHWQQGNSAYQENEPRLPLLHHAIKSGAPVALIREIMQTWQNRNLDLNLQWAQTGVRRRRSQLFIEPTYLAAICGRVDVIQELLNRGASVAMLDRAILMTPLTLWSQRRLSDQAWADLENLALQQPAVMTSFRSYMPFQRRACLLYKDCAMSGWIRLLALFIEPVVRLGATPTQLAAGPSAPPPPPVDPAQVDPDHWMMHHFLGIEVEQWLNVVGHVRVDNTAMIDYIFSLYERSERVTGTQFSLSQWCGLDEMVFRSNTLLRHQPLRITNAAHLINTFGPTTFWLGSARDQKPYRDACLVSDDRLPLLQAVLTQTILSNQQTQRRGGDDWFEIFEHKINRMGFVLLHRAMTSRPEGRPNVVRWLVLGSQVPR